MEMMSHVMSLRQLNHGQNSSNDIYLLNRLCLRIQNVKFIKEESFVRNLSERQIQQSMDMMLCRNCQTSSDHKTDCIVAFEISKLPMTDSLLIQVRQSKMTYMMLREVAQITYFSETGNVVVFEMLK